MSCHRLLTSLVLFALFSCVHNICALELTGDIRGCHDPGNIIADTNGDYWIFSTGNNVAARRSSDLIDWFDGSRNNRLNPFSYASGVPPWMDSILSSLEGHDGPWNLWAPDIIQLNGAYYLYYSRNMWDPEPGANHEISGCGVATAATLAARDWTDQGPVITTDLFADSFRVIDPALIVDQQDRFWMAAGSFGSPNGSGFVNGGIRIFEMDPANGKRLDPNDQGTRIAGPWIEAPYLHYHDGYYYLFFNQETCCAGTDSRYYIRVGRSTSITGPYFDSLGRGLLQNEMGGDLFMGRDYPANYSSGAVPRPNFGSLGREIGPGHVGILAGVDGFDRFTYHFYDGDANGAHTLGLRTMIWSEQGWPRPGYTLPDGNYAVANLTGDAADSPHGNRYLDVVNQTGDYPIATHWDGSWSQTWRFERVGLNEYRILSARTQLALVSDAQGRLAFANYNANFATHRWFVEQTSDRSFRVLNEATGLALSASGAEVVSSGWTHADSQRWWITPTGIVTLTSQYSGLAAGIPNSDPGTQVDQFSYFGSPLQQWRLIPTRRGFTRIQSVGSGLVLGLRNNSTAESTAIEQQALDDNAATQQWSIEPLPDGSLRIINRASQQVMDIPSPDALGLAAQTRWLGVRNHQWTTTLLEPTPTGIEPESASTAAQNWLSY